MMKIYAEPRKYNKARIGIFGVKNVIAMFLITAVSIVFAVFLSDDLPYSGSFSVKTEISFIVLLILFSVSVIYLNIQRMILKEKYIRSFTIWVIYNDKLYMVYEDIIKKNITFFGKSTIQHELAMNILRDAHMLRKMFDSGKSYNGVSFYQVDRICRLKKKKSGAIFFLDDGRKIKINSCLNNYGDLIWHMEKINDIERKINKVVIEL